MALSAPLITAGYVGAMTSRWSTLALRGKAVWTESGALPYTTTQVALPLHDNAGDPVFTIISPVDLFIAIGPSPNASSGPRNFVPANSEHAYYCQPGDKLAAVAA